MRLAYKTSTMIWGEGRVKDKIRRHMIFRRSTRKQMDTLTFTRFVIYREIWRT